TGSAGVRVRRSCSRQGGRVHRTASYRRRGRGCGGGRRRRRGAERRTTAGRRDRGSLRRRHRGHRLLCMVNTMFSGIVEETGRVGESPNGDGRMLISAERVVSDARPGDSIAVGGACLTVTAVL